MPKERDEGFIFEGMRLLEVEKKFETKLGKLEEVIEDFYQFSLESGDRNSFDEETFKMRYGKPSPYSSWWSCYLGTKDKISNLGFNLRRPWIEVIDLLRRLSLSQGYNKVRIRVNNRKMSLIKSVIQN